MSDQSQGPGWWQASDLKWYPPDQVPGTGATDPTTADPTSSWGAAPETPDWGAPASGSTWGTDVSSPTPAGPPPGAAPYGTAPGYGPPGPAAYGPPAYGAGPYGGVPGYQAYGAYPAGYGYGSGLPSVNGLATASMVLGIISLVTFFCWGLGAVLGVVGIILGAVALSRIKSGAADPQPRGQALAGVICSSISVAITVAFLVFLIAVNA